MDIEQRQPSRRPSWQEFALEIIIECLHGELLALASLVIPTEISVDIPISATDCL